MNKRVVIKFGGADLTTPDRIKQAAQMVVNAQYEEKVVVVSAMGKTTSELLEVIEHFETSVEDYAEIVSMGERTSARIFCSALRANNCKSVFFDPQQKEFPIITDSQFLNARPINEKTNEQIIKHLEPILSDTIPVICGFLGRDVDGRITTLGRGGSDTTAIVLASYLKADDVILVKDINGVLSADPKYVSKGKKIKQISIYEMFTLAQGGARIIRAESLYYKLSDQRLLIVNFSANDLSKISTEITGDFHSNDRISSIEEVSALTLIGLFPPQNLKKIFDIIDGATIYDISTGRKCITIFGQFVNIEQIMKALHQLDLFTAISYKDGFSKIEIIHPQFIDHPGWVARVTHQLATNNINLVEVTTSKATINLFVEEQFLESAIKTVEVVCNEI